MPSFIWAKYKKDIWNRAILSIQMAFLLCENKKIFPPGNICLLGLVQKITPMRFHINYEYTIPHKCQLVKLLFKKQRIYELNCYLRFVIVAASHNIGFTK